MAAKTDPRASREGFWRKLVAEQRRSGLSQAEFCRRRGLVPGTFAWWKRELKRRDGGHSRAAKSGFVPVRVIERRLTGARTCSFDVELRNGRRIRVPNPFDPESLRRLLAVLELEEERGVQPC